MVYLSARTYDRATRAGVAARTRIGETRSAFPRGPAATPSFRAARAAARSPVPKCVHRALLCCAFPQCLLIRSLRAMQGERVAGEPRRRAFSGNRATMAFPNPTSSSPQGSKIDERPAPLDLKSRPRMLVKGDRVSSSPSMSNAPPQASSPPPASQPPAAAATTSAANKRCLISPSACSRAINSPLLTLVRSIFSQEDDANRRR